MSSDTDLLIIGGGPAGATAAILMARAGWRVTVIEREEFPRQKVCGECVAAGNLDLIDELGVGREFQKLAGPELRQAGWMRAHRTLKADMPRCTDGKYPFGRALGRDRFDALLLEQARAVGATVLQPATVGAIRGTAGNFICEYSLGAPHGVDRRGAQRAVSAAVVVDAHGSWDRGPIFGTTGAGQKSPVRRSSDLFAFKARFCNTKLERGFLPVLAIEGGYGGMVVADDERTTIACCVRRDVLKRCRSVTPDSSAGASVELLLRRSCPGLRLLLDGAQRDGPWLSVGPIRPGIRVNAADSIFRVGNAAGETHPLIGEGISMALQSAKLLAIQLRKVPPGDLNRERHDEVQRLYNSAWRRTFTHRLMMASGYAHMAMQPLISRQVGAVLHRWPQLLTQAARWSGKARYPSIDAPFESVAT
jgi:flavin-dependent dehydrogenase